MTESAWKRACAKLPTESLVVLASALLLDLKAGANQVFVFERIFIIIDELGSRVRLLEEAHASSGKALLG